MSAHVEAIIRGEINRVFREYRSDFERGMPKIRFYSRRAQNKMGGCSHLRGEVHFNFQTIAPYGVEAAKWVALHEIAHWTTPGQKHSAVWSARFQKYGGDGKRVYSPAPHMTAIFKVFDQMKIEPPSQSLISFSQPRKIYDPTTKTVINPNV